MAISHAYPFDPTYGYSLATLLQVPAPQEPQDFQSFWESRYAETIDIEPSASLHELPDANDRYKVFEIEFSSTDGFRVGGWLTVPKTESVDRAMVVSHGYGGRDGPDFDLPVDRTAFIFPCARGISRSRCPGISENPAFHVLHNIDKPSRYLLGACVEDIWLAASTILQLFPETEDRLGYMGISFGGGIGAMALAWDKRFGRGHLNVPSFGNQALRLTLDTVGSGAAVRAYERRHGHVMATLHYYDGAIAARHISIPMHVACALFDPAVAPPGQFAIHNALGGPKELFVLDAGHYDYPGRQAQEEELKKSLRKFFEDL